MGAATEAAAKNPPAKKKCDVCNESFSAANFSRHRKTHDIHPEPTGLREYCRSCDQWFSYKARQQHFDQYHDGNVLVRSDKATVVDPSNEQIVKPRRVGPRSKKYKHPVSENVLRSWATQGAANAEEEEQEGEQEQEQRGEEDNDDDDDEQRTSTPNRPTSEASTLVEGLATTKYYERWEEAIMRALEQIVAQHHEIEKGEKYPEQSRIRQEFFDYTQVIASAVTPESISAVQYREIRSELRAGRKVERYLFVVCTMDEAREILEEGLPLLPIIVPEADIPTMQLHGVGNYLSELETKRTLDVTDFTLTEEESSRQPRAVAARDAVAMFRDEAGLPLNLLNLECSKDNPIPRCLSGLKAYDILQRMKNSQDSGKEVYIEPRDLTNCATFHVCSKTGVWSDAHHDNYGKMTTLFIEDGEKLIPVWPTLTDEEREAWAQKEAGSCPDLPPFLLFLGPGDLYIQPPMTVHAPYTLKDCLMTGTQHFHSPSMHVHLRGANFDRRHETTTNEGESTEALIKFRMIRQAMRSSNPRWPWPTVENRELFEEEFKTYASGFVQVSCECNDGCQDREKCACRQIQQPCTPYCHPEKRTNKKRKRKATAAMRSAGAAGKCQNSEEEYGEGDMDNDGDQIMNE